MSINLNNTIPAAPANATNVVWQEDVSGNVSAYVGTAANVLPAVDTTGLTGNVSATTLFATTASRTFRISAYIIVTTAGSVSSTLPKITITWTDADNSQAQSFDLTPTNAGNALTTFEQAEMVIRALTTTNIQYATSSYASSAAGMTYAIHLTIEIL
jgi:hypothetical protein